MQKYIIYILEEKKNGEIKSPGTEGGAKETISCSSPPKNAEEEKGREKKKLLLLAVLCRLLDNFRARVLS